MKFIKSVFALSFLFSHIAFAATLKDAENRLFSIEDFKMMVSDEETISSGEREALQQLYDELESDEYTVSSLSGDLSFEIGHYSLESESWPIEVKGSFFSGLLDFERHIDMKYSVMLEKKYVPVREMTVRQRESYEYYVNDYEDRFNAGESLIYGELTFRITHWLNDSQYRFEPRTLKIYRISRYDRILDIIPLTDEKKFFESIPAVDVRTEKEKRQDLHRVRRIVKNDVKEDATIVLNYEEDDKYVANKENKGRRALFLSVNFENEEFDFADMDVRSFSFDNLQGFLTWGISKYLFAGIGIGYDLRSMNKSSIYSFNVLFGGNYEFANHFRPYVELGAGASTANYAGAKAGFGMDFIMGNFMVTLGYDYNWQAEFDTFKSDEDRRYNGFNTFSIGAGFAW